MRERESRERGLHQFGQQLAGTDFHQPWRSGNQIGFPDARMDRKNPPRAAHASLIGNFTLIKVSANRF